ncbi:hypothetical protein N658DRAFT_319747 [Parathielavia hyrcaniae]|uniref:Uncharacterized protein n=1 Tax=Parathielavia hyrcaniae TaxID=113614 RepID=A0AAN6PS41_9PEZI|nr:hypothetical protein N658DRAFT_319747 [Parathielavia hyrcaniae]
MNWKCSTSPYKSDLRFPPARPQCRIINTMAELTGHRIRRRKMEVVKHGASILFCPCICMLGCLGFGGWEYQAMRRGSGVCWCGWRSGACLCFVALCAPAFASDPSAKSVFAGIRMNSTKFPPCFNSFPMVQAENGNVKLRSYQ